MSKSAVFRINYLFKKYLDNACSAAELDELFELIEKDEYNEELKDLLTQLWFTMPVSEKRDQDKGVQEDRYQHLLTKIAREEKSYRFIPHRAKPWLRYVAASLLLMFMFSAYWFYNKPVNKPVNTVAIPRHKLPAYVRVIRLSDGSTVYLNKNSHLDHPAVFSRKKREVFLTGEAYFDIKHDTKRPFFVHAGGAVTQVLGTAFNIKMVGDQVKITVTRGKVGVMANRKLLGILTPNQQLSYNDATGKSKQSNINAQSTVLWKEPDLVMDNMTLRDAALLLEQHYGVSIKLTDAVAGCRFNASFLNTTTIDQVLNVLAHLNELTIQKEAGNTYLLSGPGCAN